MRIAVLADIHGNLPALEAVLADIAGRGVEQIVTLGDHLSGPLLPAETAAFLMAQPWVQIGGNHERQLLAFDPATGGLSDGYAHRCLGQEHFAWLRSLPPVARLGDEVFLCHGSPRSDRELLLEAVALGRTQPATTVDLADRLAGETSPVVLCGHSHLPGSRRTARDQLLANPGSVGLPAYGDTDPKAGHYVIENDSPDAHYALLERHATGWAETLVSVAYDFEPMARLAEHNHRPEWACALRTGRVLPALA
jgi:predicted phosphodiesterase